MKLLAAVTAVPVVVTSIATGDLIYLVYVVGVLYAVFGWTPSWGRVSMPRPLHLGLPASEVAKLLARARRWRTVLVVASGVSALLMGQAYLEVIVRGSGLAWAALYTAISFALMTSAFMAHGEIEGLTL